jgi:hypothetical protein
VEEPNADLDSLGAVSDIHSSAPALFQSRFENILSLPHLLETLYSLAGDMVMSSSPSADNTEELDITLPGYGNLFDDFGVLILQFHLYHDF